MWTINELLNGTPYDMRIQACNGKNNCAPRPKAGHATGLTADGNEHPSVREAIAAGKRSLANCSPHPLDVMAISALYQAFSTP